MNRRELLTRAAVAVAALPWWTPRIALAARDAAPQGDALVCIFLRGAADGLNMLVPHGEAAYYRHRPTLAIPRPDDRGAVREQRTADLDGFFGLHPALSPLLPAWRAGQLAAVHACGGPDESRSHFQAMELIERGAADNGGPQSGWLGRHLAAKAGSGSPLRAVGFGEQLPRALYGPVPATALRSIADFHLGGKLPATASLQQALGALYRDDGRLTEVARGTLDVAAVLARLDLAGYRPAGGARYPESELGLALRQTAMLIRAEVGLEVACVDVGGWDTHVAQGGSSGPMAALLADLAGGLAAFHADLADRLDRLTVVVLSEFGRRAQENGGLGTDHGHGGLMLLLGGGIAGGRVYGSWPGLEPEQLVGPGDLAITTDYRDVLGELVQRRLGNPRAGEVFPGYTVRELGVTRYAEIAAGDSGGGRARL